MSIRNNTPRRNFLIWMGITFLGLITIFVPGIIGLDGFDGGFALSFFGGFVAIIGIIGAVIYARLAGTVDHLLRKEGILAHWTYSPEYWRKYTEIEYTEDKSAKKGLFLMVAVIAVIVGIVLWLIKRDNPMVIFLIVLGIIAIAGISALLSIYSSHRQNLKYVGETFISRDGVYINRQIHIWKGIGNQLESIEFDNLNASLPRIVIEYSSPGKNSRNYYTARVPVPPGEEEKAKQIVFEISSTHLNRQ